MADIALAFVEFGYFIGIGVEADDAVAGFGKSQAERQPDIAASDHAHF